MRWRAWCGELGCKKTRARVAMGMYRRVGTDRVLLPRFLNFVRCQTVETYIFDTHVVLPHAEHMVLGDFIVETSGFLTPRRCLVDRPK